MRKTGILLLLLFACALVLWGQNTPPADTPARMIVTTGHFYGRPAPLLTANDLTVTETHESLPITNVVPLRGDRAALDMFILVDACSSCEAGSQFEDLRKFITAQSPATNVGVAYIREGLLKVALNPTKDRVLTVLALTTPSGNKPTTPFRALAELLRTWKPDSSRHAVLMISNGVNPEFDGVRQDPSAEEAIQEAQRAGVAVYAIYHPGADYAAADPLKIYSGQVQLAHVAVETGGEAYFLGFGPLPSLSPFLADIADHLANQYLVEFLAKPGEGAGLEEFSVKSKIADVEVTAPSRIWIETPPAARGK